MKIRLSLLIFCGLSFTFLTKAQKESEIITTNPIQIIKNANPLIYYGVDFSHVRISDGKKVTKNEVYYKAYPPSWITYVEKELPPIEYVKKSLNIYNFYYNQEEIYPISISVFPDFITGSPYSFPIDTVKNAIKKYTLSQKSGTGLVLIPENFSKSQEKAFTWVVFFDIQKREILYAKRFPGNCEHMGYTAHWMSGVIDGFKGFVTEINRKN